MGKPSGSFLCQRFPPHTCASFLIWLVACSAKEGAPKPIDPVSDAKAPPMHAPFGEPEEDAPWPLSVEAHENAKQSFAPAEHQRKAAHGAVRGGSNRLRTDKFLELLKLAQVADPF
jgi:hypothetical protein